VDAGLIARFCQAINPSPWTPLPAEIKELQELMRRLEALQQMEQQERNRLETSTGVITELILSHLEGLHQQQKQVKQLIRDHFQRHPHLGKQQELLTSIPGIGELSASVLPRSPPLDIQDSIYHRPIMTVSILIELTITSMPIQLLFESTMLILEIFLHHSLTFSCYSLSCKLTISNQRKHSLM